MNTSLKVDAEPLLDVGDLAEFLGVKTSYVRRLVWERRIPYLKMGKYIRFVRAEIVEWLEAFEIQPLR